MEQPQPLTYKEVRVDRERYRQLAHKLYQTHWEQIVIEKSSSSHISLEEALRKISPEVLNQYAGHGVSRGEDEDQIAAVMSIIENNAIVGDIAPLVNSGHIDAYAHGGFLILLDKEEYRQYRQKTFEERSRSRLKLLFEDGKTSFALNFRPAAIICNGHFDPIVEPLQQMYPQTPILRASELADYLTQQEENF